MFRLKRVYEAPEASDGYRVLVDRLWPRGLSKDKASVDLWLKDIAPSNNLRKSFHHDQQDWAEFERRYRQELTDKRELIDQLKALEKQHRAVTLLFSSKDTAQNNAVVLKQVLAE